MIVEAAICTLYNPNNLDLNCRVPLSNGQSLFHLDDILHGDLNAIFQLQTLYSFWF